MLSGSVSFEQATGRPLGQSCDEELIQHRRQQGIVPFHDRIRVFSSNRLPKRKPDSVLLLLWRAYNDKTLIVLTIAAVVSLALGVYQALSGRSKVDWVEGVAICIAIFVIVAVTASNDWQKERQFRRLTTKVEPSTRRLQTLTP